MGESYKVPHMGWNRLEWVNASPITANLEEDYAYFVHSYYVVTNNPEISLQKHLIMRTFRPLLENKMCLGCNFIQKKAVNSVLSCYGILQGLH